MVPEPPTFQVFPFPRQLQPKLAVILSTGQELQTPLMPPPKHQRLPFLFLFFFLYLVGSDIR